MLNDIIKANLLSRLLKAQSRKPSKTNVAKPSELRYVTDNQIVM